MASEAPWELADELLFVHAASEHAHAAFHSLNVSDQRVHAFCQLIHARGELVDAVVDFVTMIHKLTDQAREGEEVIPDDRVTQAITDVRVGPYDLNDAVDVGFGQHH